MSDSIFFTDGNGTIIGMTDTSYSGKLIIPEYVGGEQIVKIGEWAIYNITGLTSVIIPNSVITIAEGAFEACADLVYVTIPNNVTSIDVNAFHLCQNLTTIYVPDPNNLSTAVSSYDWSTTGSSGVTFMQDPAYIDYLIKGSSLISLSDKIRILSGTTDSMTPSAMDTKLGSANTEVDTQTDLIAQIATALEGKTLPDSGSDSGSGAGVETCDVVIDDGGNMYVSSIACTVFDDTGMFAVKLDANDSASNGLYSISNVLRNSFIIIESYDNNIATEGYGVTHLLSKASKNDLFDWVHIFEVYDTDAKIYLSCTT